jgi:hypothetical protein
MLFGNSNIRRTKNDLKEERRKELEDERLGEQALQETHPAKIRADGEKERNRRLKEGEQVKKNNQFLGMTPIEKQFAVYCNKQRHNLPNLYRHLVSARKNLTYVISCLNNDFKIDVHTFKYLRLNFEKIILRSCWRINKSRKDEKLFQGNKNDLLLSLYHFRENILDIKISELESGLVESMIDEILEAPREHIFSNGKKIIIEKMEELPKVKRYNTIIVDQPRHQERQKMHKTDQNLIGEKIEIEKCVKIVSTDGQKYILQEGDIVEIMPEVEEKKDEKADKKTALRKESYEILRKNAKSRKNKAKRKKEFLERAEKNKKKQIDKLKTEFKEKAKSKKINENKHYVFKRITDPNAYIQTRTKKYQSWHRGDSELI